MVVFLVRNHKKSEILKGTIQLETELKKYPDLVCTDAISFFDSLLRTGYMFCLVHSSLFAPSSTFNPSPQRCASLAQCLNQAFSRLIFSFSNAFLAASFWADFLFLPLPLLTILPSTFTPTVNKRLLPSRFC